MPTSTPAAAASAEPIANVNEMTLFASMPMSCAVSVSNDTARIALPIFVFCTMYVSSAISTMVMEKMRICWPFTTKLPIVMPWLSNTAGNVRGVGETKYIIVYSRKNDTPMAVISTESLGAWRSGLYAHRSTMMPRTAVTTMEIMSAGNTPTCIIVIEKNPT